MTAFDPSAYGPAVAALLLEAPLNPLGPGRPDVARRPNLAALATDDAFGPVGVVDRDAAAACRAGLWLRYDFFDESHAVSQELHTPEGGYWHAILHRREPDASNAAYWFRRVGRHPVFEPLTQEATALGLAVPSGRWDPFAFIDLCEKERGKNTDRETLLRQVQRREWELLFDRCFRRATGRE